MFDFSETRSQVIVGAAFLVVVGALVYFWMKSAPPAPAPMAGQTIENPGGAAPGGAAQTIRSPVGTPQTNQSPMGAAQAPVASGGAAAAPAGLPPPGTFDPQRGFGPSPGAQVGR